MFTTRVILPLLLFPLIIFITACSSGGDGGSTTPPPSPPFVTAVTPVDTSDTALVTSIITARFSERMDRLTLYNPDTSTNLTPNSFIVRDSLGQQVHGSVEFYGTYDGYDNVAVFTPHADLAIGGAYSAMITTDATDTTGTALASAYPWDFTIAPAQLVVSTDGTGTVGNSGVVTASPSDIDGTGEYIVFASTDSLITGIPTVPAAQIYRKNTVTGRLELVSLGDTGQLANGACETPRISDTGRFVVFASTATNLDSDITQPDGLKHIYLKDMKNGNMTLLDRHPIDTFKPGNNSSFRPAISGTPKDDPQGRYVVFDSLASDLVDGVIDNNSYSDIFLVLPAGDIQRISVDSTGNQSNGPSFNPRVSDDGRRIVFESDANNLVLNDNNTATDIFLRVRNTTLPPTGTTSRLSLDTNGTEANGPSSNADISADGQFAVFQSNANNLILSGDTNGATDIFLRDINTPATSRMSVDVNGSEVTGASTRPSISGDGQYVAFQSVSTLLVTPDINGSDADIFVRDKNAASTITRLSVNNLGEQGNDPSTNAIISSNGRYVSFTTPWAFDITDNNGQADIYRAYNAALP